MELIENLQKLTPWAVDLDFSPKIILSLLICGVALLFLSVIWTTPGTTEKTSLNAIGNILEGCYKRAVFTRTHAQMSHEAMFKSISNCRALVQKEIPKIANADYRQQAANIMAALEGIEREKENEPWDFNKIDKFKLEALRGFKVFERETGKPYPVPKSLTEDVFFSQEDADRPPTISIQQGNAADR